VPVDYYPQKSVEELLVILSAIQDRASVGRISMVQSSGMSTMRTVQGSDRTAVEIRRVLYSLHRRDPVTYTDPHADRVTRTEAVYK